MEVVKGSKLAFSSKLDVGTLPESDIGIEYSEEVPYYPSFNIKDTGNPIVIHIPPSNNLFITLYDSKLYGKAKVTTSEGKALSSADSVAPTNNFFRAAFSSCEVALNSTIVSKSSSLFPYRGHMLDKLTHGKAFKEGLLINHIYEEDAKADDFSASNKGFLKRLEMCQESHSFEFLGKLSESIFDCPKFIPPEVGVKIILKRSEPEFCLVSGTEPKPSYLIEFEEIILFVPKYSINSSVIAHHNRLLNSNGKLFYPLQLIDMRCFNISAGTQVITSENLFRTNLPQYIVVSFITSEAFNGKLNKSCFVFSHFNVQKIRVAADGDSNSFYREVHLDVDNNVTIMAYNTIYKALESPEHGAPFTKEQFLEGDFFVVLELLPSTVANSLSPQRHGQVKLDLKFKNPLTETITCLVMGVFQSIMTIDKQKNVSMDTFGN